MAFQSTMVLPEPGRPSTKRMGSTASTKATCADVYGGVTEPASSTSFGPRLRWSSSSPATGVVIIVVADRPHDDGAVRERHLLDRRGALLRPPEVMLLAAVAAER